MLAPPPLPKLQRSLDNAGNEVMTGEQALDNIAMLYGAYGDVRATLITLQEMVRVTVARQE
jgi:hypothetical protein